MAVTFDELKKILEATDLNFFVDSEKELVILGFSGCYGVHHLLLKLVENGEGLLFKVPGLAMLASDHPFKAKVLETLLAENNRIKIGRFCYDPSDGEIYLDWFIPIEDGTITPQQLRRSFIALMHIADEMTPRLQHLMKLGEDLPPEEVSVPGMLRRLLREGLRRGLVSEDAETRLRRLLAHLEGGEREEGL